MNSNEFEDILYEKEKNGICTLIFNRPERKNALSQNTFLEIITVLTDMEYDDNAHILIITGCEEANAFSSGGYFDLKFFSPRKSESINGASKLSSSDLLTPKGKEINFYDFSKPVIAAINGLAIGAGITMPLMGADLIFMSENAWLEFNFVKRGIIAQSAMSFILPLYLGFQKAKEILYLGEKLSAQEAEKLGFINKVVPSDELINYTRTKALQLLAPKAPSFSIKLMKKTLHTHFREIILRTMDLERESNQFLFKSHDTREALRAFKDKRLPHFKGR